MGGHSQGGFLTYSILMNTPEMIAGAFPISCGVIFQCEPSAYKDEALLKAQRSVPLAIVHGRNDPMVDFGMGSYAAGPFGESNWPRSNSSPATRRANVRPLSRRRGHPMARVAILRRPRGLAGLRREATRGRPLRDTIAALRRGQRPSS